MKIKFKSMQTQVREGGRDSIFGLDDSLIPYTHYVYNGDYTL